MKKQLLVLITALLLCLSGCGDTADNNNATAENTITAEGTLLVHFIDVGQADCTLIQSEGYNMLIDAGNVADGDLVVQYLAAQGVDYLDYVIATHAHEDHIGGLTDVLEAYDCAVFYSPVDEYDSNAFTNVMATLEEQNVPVTFPSLGETFTMGEASFQIVAPSDFNWDTNNSSIVLHMSHGNISFLFTGDAELESEEYMLDSGLKLSATVLKAGHHGSSTSSSYAFLRAVMPEFIFVPVGADNTYGHPSEAVLSRFEDLEATVFRADLDGTCVFISDGESLTITTEKGDSIYATPDRDTTAGLDTLPPVTSGDTEESTETTEETESQTEEITAQYIGNKNSLVLHASDCGSLPNEENRVYFDSLDEALAEGYRVHSACLA